MLKEATSRFTERVRMRSVDTNRRLRHCSIPERCVSWLANVSARYDRQVLNRMLTCWVDDSEAQDREVFRRQLADEARPAREAVAARFDLAVCREIWRACGCGARPCRGAVRGADPDGIGGEPAEPAGFARPGAEPRAPLLPPAAGRDPRGRHARGDGDRGGLRYATGLFVALHAGGSLGSKFDRDEDRVLAEAARRSVERFTVADVQRWMGWSYTIRRTGR